MSAVADLFRRLSDRRQEKRDTQLSEIHQAIIALAEDGAGKNGDLDLDYYADLIENEGLTEADLQARGQEILRNIAVARGHRELADAAEAWDRRRVNFQNRSFLRRNRA